MTPEAADESFPADDGVPASTHIGSERSEGSSPFFETRSGALERVFVPRPRPMVGRDVELVITLQTGHDSVVRSSIFVEGGDDEG